MYYYYIFYILYEAKSFFSWRNFWKKFFFNIFLYKQNFVEKGKCSNIYLNSISKRYFLNNSLKSVYIHSLKRYFLGIETFRTLTLLSLLTTCDHVVYSRKRDVNGLYKQSDTANQCMYTLTRVGHRSSDLAKTACSDSCPLISDLRFKELLIWIFF